MPVNISLTEDDWLPTEVVMMVGLGNAAFEMKAGLAMTMDTVEGASAETIMEAYKALVKAEGLHPDGAEKRKAVCYAVQKVWYDKMRGGEPVTVVKRRKELYERLQKAPDGPVPRERTPSKREARIPGPSTADLIRRCLTDGMPTDEILKTVQSADPQSKADAKAVAYYRYHMRKSGELPPKGEGRGKDSGAGQGRDVRPDKPVRARARRRQGPARRKLRGADGAAHRPQARRRPGVRRKKAR